MRKSQSQPLEARKRVSNTLPSDTRSEAGTYEEKHPRNANVATPKMEDEENHQARDNPGCNKLDETKDMEPVDRVWIAVVRLHFR